ncbi:class I SAM-dependent methyltransferase [Mycobacterium sp.]|uniref:class I SAM-dependent methyltransferase n=1 Tax=Mycobacterium sp. TaxID=1785 RepID=UPI003CAEE297
MTINVSTGIAAPLATTPQALWALGDYALMAEEVMAPLGPVLVASTGITEGDRVLDVAAGSGNISIPAAKMGANVVSSDLTPELLARSQIRAAAEGVKLQWREANAESLPFGDGEFDAVVSAIGVMFAPRHQRAADELIRVCRSGGTIGVISWTYEGFFGQMLNALRPYQPTVRPGVPPASLWGREGYAVGLLGERVSDVRTRRAMLKVDRFNSAQAVHEYFKNHYGPTINAYRTIGNNSVLAATLDAQLVELAQQHLNDGVMGWEYLVVTARKR